VPTPSAEVLLGFVPVLELSVGDTQIVFDECIVASNAQGSIQVRKACS